MTGFQMPGQKSIKLEIRILKAGVEPGFKKKTPMFFKATFGCPLINNVTQIFGFLTPSLTSAKQITLY